MAVTNVRSNRKELAKQHFYTQELEDVKMIMYAENLLLALLPPCGHLNKNTFDGATTTDIDVLSGFLVIIRI